MDKSCTKRVLMARNVATAWLQAHSSEEYRLHVYPTLGSAQTLPSWLKAFRDGKSKFGSLQPFDFAVEIKADSFCIRSRDKSALITLNAKLEEMGHETSGVW